MIKLPKIEEKDKVLLYYFYPIFVILLATVLFPKIYLYFLATLIILIASYNCMLKLRKPHMGFNIFEQIAMFLLPSIILIALIGNYFYPIG